MKTSNIGVMTAGCLLIILSGCASTGVATIPVDFTSSAPGTTVTSKGEPRQLTGTALQVGGQLPATVLTDAYTMKQVDLSQLKGNVLLISLVPSVDTRVCEAQTHYLGEQGARLPAGITRITISRDTPFAQKRFAEEARLNSITFLSDYRDGSFGRATGLLLDESMLLARSVIVADRQGVVRYIQVVPELSHLPDLEAAFAKAEALLNGPVADK
jgi:thioredoxin-dependent peroxiredoxin